MYGRKAAVAVCAWEGMYSHVGIKFKQLQECSLIKVVNGKLWLHDMIKAIAIKQAEADNQQCMTRIWRNDQVRVARHLCCSKVLIPMTLLLLLHAADSKPCSISAKFTDPNSYSGVNDCTDRSSGHVFD
jgi:hypothetical protein